MSWKIRRPSNWWPTYPDRSGLSEQEADDLLKKLSDHFNMPVMPVKVFCEAISHWAECIRQGVVRTEPLKKENPYRTAQGQEYVDHLTHILIDIQKSALLYRLIYTGEEVRTELCPEHLGNLEMGIWIGDPDAKSCVCGGTGWLPRPAGVPHPWHCSHKEIWDEPPQCASCQAYVCGNCGVLLGSPIGFCAKCAEATTPEALEERKRYCLPRTTIQRPDET